MKKNLSSFFFNFSIQQLFFKYRKKVIFFICCIVGTPLVNAWLYAYFFFLPPPSVSQHIFLIQGSIFSSHFPGVFRDFFLFSLHISGIKSPPLLLVLHCVFLYFVTLKQVQFLHYFFTFNEGINITITFKRYKHPLITYYHINASLMAF